MEEIVFGKKLYEQESSAPFVLKVEDDGNNCLKILLCLSQIEKTEQDFLAGEDFVLEKLFEKCSSVLPDYKNAYEICFDNYIVYQTQNESYCSGSPYDEKCGDYLVIYNKSRLLDNIQNFTDCQVLSDGTFYPEKWTHYGIISRNHIVDIISCNKPTIKKVEMSK